MFRLASDLYKRRQANKHAPAEKPFPVKENTPQPAPNRPASAPPVIEVSHLEKSYGKVHAVNDVSFTVRGGEVFSLLGPNGAGKSTTVEIMEGLRNRNAGDVRVLGLDPWTRLNRLKSRIGVIPQDFHFFPRLTPREAVRLYARLFGLHVDADELLARVELLDKADDLYETLSGGQHQKVGVALALVNDPEVCFLDEPTTGLDPRVRRSIWDVIRRLRNEGRAVFLTTHYLDEAQHLADHIAIINEGHIVAGGTPDALIAQFGRPERMCIVGDTALADRLRPLGLQVATSAGSVEVELRSKADALSILQAVSASGLRWESVSTVSDTLEDVFIRLVGRLEEGAIAAPTLPGAAT